MESANNAPVLVPMELDDFWNGIRQIVRDELTQVKNDRLQIDKQDDCPGFREKPLYKIAEVCMVFKISRQTVYNWIKEGRLKPYKIQKTLFFLGADIRAMIGEGQ